MKALTFRKPAFLSKWGRILTLTGSVLMFLWCVWELSVRFDVFYDSISGIATMSHLKEESFFRNLFYYFHDAKVQATVLRILFLAMCVLMSGLSFLLIRRRWSCILLLSACIALGFAGMSWGYYGIPDANIFIMIKWIPLLLIFVGSAICLVNQMRIHPQKTPQDRVSRAGALAEKDGNEMRVMVSACLLGKNCKYNGGNNTNEAVLRFLENKLIIPVCPEVMGGLSTPRPPAELRWGHAVDAEGHSVDEYYRKGAMKCIALARKEHATLAILKSNSPSCSIRQVYDGSFSGKLVQGRGIFGDMVIREGIPVLDETDFKETTINGN